jgi:hypothetical protein
VSWSVGIQKRPNRDHGRFRILKGYDESTALRLWLDILDGGVNIVHLTPHTVFKHERFDISDIIRAIIELSRGHSESAARSNRTTANWETQRKNARENGRVITRRLPGWVTEHDGKLALIPERAAVVRRIFELSAAGYGAGVIVKRFTAEAVPAFGARGAADDGRTRQRKGDYYGCGEWRTSYVRQILSDRRALGEYQPRDSDEQPTGEALSGYYPRVVTDAEFLAVRASVSSRRNKTGRVGEGVANLFGGLLVNARDGSTYYAATRSEGGKLSRVLLNKSSIEGRSRASTFPLSVFECAMLSRLQEIEPSDVLPKPPRRGSGRRQNGTLLGTREEG